jgi:hypothetical protein
MPVPPVLVCGIESNIQICDGNLAYFCGTSLGFMDIIRIQVQAEYTRHKLAKQNLLPSQILADHMRKLDEIERQVSLGNSPSTQRTQ